MDSCHVSIMSHLVGVCLGLEKQKFDYLGAAVLYSQVQQRLSHCFSAVIYFAVLCFKHLVHFYKLSGLVVLDKLDKQELLVFVGNLLLGVGLASQLD